MSKKFFALLLSVMMVLSMMTGVAMAEGEVTYYVSSTGDDAAAGTEAAPFATIQKAVDVATSDTKIVILSDITGNVKITQKANVNLVIDGGNHTFTGVMTVFGDARQDHAETLIIQNFIFQAVSSAESCIVSPDRLQQDPARYSYSHNVTVQNCIFKGNATTPLIAAAIRHEDGGDKNWSVIGCTVDENMHSLLQVNNVEGKLTVENCKVYSKNGINLNSCTNVEVTGCTFEVSGYAVRAGVKTGGNPDETKTYVLEDNTLKTDDSEGDAVIVLRSSAKNMTITMEQNIVSGEVHIDGNESGDNNTLNVDKNYWDGEPAPVVGENDVAIKVDTYLPTPESTTPADSEGYSVTIKPTVNGSVSADKMTGVLYGTTVTLTITPDTGYQLDTLTVTTNEGTESVEVTGNTFTMPVGNVEVEAEFGPAAFTIYFNTMCNAYVAPIEVDYLDEIPTLPIPFRQGYEFIEWLGIPADGKMPAEDITLTATWRQTYFQIDTPVKPITPVTPVVPSEPEVDDDSCDGLLSSGCAAATFADLDSSAWYHDAVDYVLENGLMQGIGDNKFAPYTTTSRAMIVTILYRLEGEPVVGSANPFSDVEADEWYTDAVLWAAENEIVLGYDGAFMPEDEITLEQALLILQRYAEYKGIDEITVPMIAPYEYSTWAENGVVWAYLNGVLEIGTDLDDLTAPATRAELAGFLYAFCK